MRNIQKSTPPRQMFALLPRATHLDRETLLAPTCYEGVTTRRHEPCAPADGVPRFANAIRGGAYSRNWFGRPCEAIRDSREPRSLSADARLCSQVLLYKAQRLNYTLRTLVLKVHACVLVHLCVRLLSVAIHNPLTGYEPNQLDNFDYSEASAAIFQDESAGKGFYPTTLTL